MAHELTPRKQQLASIHEAFKAIPILTKKRENNMNSMTFTKTAAPDWLLAMWKEIDDKTFGKGFDCFAEDAVCNLGVADWHGREAIRENMRAFIDTGFTAHHDVVEYWDSPTLKVFHGKVGMKFDDPNLKPVRRRCATSFTWIPKILPRSSAGLARWGLRDFNDAE